jgi:hypothetical protein
VLSHVHIARFRPVSNHFAIMQVLPCKHSFCATGIADRMRNISQRCPMQGRYPPTSVQSAGCDIQ